MKEKGVASNPTIEQIINYRKLTLRQKLEWLEEANQFTYKMMDKKRKKIWEDFRKGRI